MGVYSRIILPRLIHGGMGIGRLVPYRAELVRDLTGEVLEIGIGGGHNIPLYDCLAVRLTAIEPDVYLRERSAEAAARLGWPVDVQDGRAEALPFATASFDAVVSSWTLCSVADPVAALAEIARVLRPGGAFRFVEHGLSPDPGVARWQNWLNPCQQALAGGCNLNRRFDRLLAEAGFAVPDLVTGYMPGPRFACFLYRGTARPGAA